MAKIKLDLNNEKKLDEIIRKIEKIEKRQEEMFETIKEHTFRLEHMAILLDTYSPMSMDREKPLE